jgi:hypothetical protein
MQGIWMASTNKWIIFYRTPNQESKLPGLSFQDFYDILQHQRDKPRTPCELLVNYDTPKFSTRRAGIMQSIIDDVHSLFFEHTDPADAQIIDLFTFNNKTCVSKELIEGACKYIEACISCFLIADKDERKCFYCQSLVSDFEFSSTDDSDQPPTTFFLYQGLFGLYHSNQMRLWEAISSRRLGQQHKIASAPTSGQNTPKILSRPTSESSVSKQDPPQRVMMTLTSPQTMTQTVALSNKRSFSSTVPAHESPRVHCVKDTETQDSSDSGKIFMPPILSKLSANQTLSARSETLTDVMRRNSIFPSCSSPSHTMGANHVRLDSFVDNQTSEVLSEVQPRELFIKF